MPAIYFPDLILYLSILTFKQKVFLSYDRNTCLHVITFTRASHSRSYSFLSSLIKPVAFTLSHPKNSLAPYVRLLALANLI